MHEQKSGGHQTAVVFGLAGLALLIVVGGVMGYVWMDKGEPEQPGSIGDDDSSGPEGFLTPVQLVKRPLPNEGFVGSKACAKCHEELYESYQKHPMANSMFAIQDAPVIEDYENPTFDSPGNREYVVEKKGGRVFHHEVLLDDQKNPIYDMPKEVKYILGSGKRGRSYLVFENGYFYQSPVGWYAQANKFDLSPGYKGENHSRFTRRLGEGCFYCHVGRTSMLNGLEDMYVEKPFLEASIGCERCHGPGQQHIAFREAESPQSDEVDPIVNPASLGIAEAEAVCSQCHLSGESIIPRKGLRNRDFRPGQRLDDTWVIFVNGSEDQTPSLTRAVSHVEQMRVSKCYTASSGAMNCVTCHDPHSSPEPENRKSFYNERCNGCHVDKGCSLPEPERLAEPANGSCIDCHMPRFATHNIPHTAGFDHRILRRPLPSPVETRNQGMPSLVVFDDADRRLSRAEIERAMGLALVEEQIGFSDREMLLSALRMMTKIQSQEIPDAATIVNSIGDDLVVLKQVASVFQMFGDLIRANACWERALQISPNDADSRFWLVKNSLQQGALEDATTHLKFLLAINPGDFQVYDLKSQLLDLMGNLPEAIRAEEKSLELDPAQVSTRRWLLEAYRRAGLEDKRKEQLEMLRRINEATEKAKE